MFYRKELWHLILIIVSSVTEVFWNYICRKSGLNYTHECLQLDK